MRRDTARRGVTAGLVAVLTAVGAGRGSEDHHRALDVTAIAVSSADRPDVTDEAVAVGRLDGRSSTVQSSSTATSDCDGCTATSVAVTVAYAAGSRTGAVDNVSHAWSSCDGCSSRTVSVQVVVLRRAQAVRAANRALAANIACAGCTTTALAYQIVLVSPRGRTFGRAELADLVEWARGQAATLPAGPSLRGTAPGAPPGDALTELEERAETALGGARTLQRDVDRATGSP